MTTQRNLPAILLGGGIISSSAARCLGPAGIPVWALGDGAQDTAGHSRYCTEFVDLGGGHGVQERWLEWLRRRVAGEAVVLPCSDDGLELVCRHRAELVALGYRPIEANDDVALAMLDKLETYTRARRAGIDTPRHFALEDIEQLDDELIRSGVEFPCALKPLHSHLFRREFREKVLVARNRDELRSACQRVAAHNLKAMVTEIVPGPEDAYVALHAFFDERGEPLVQLTKRKLRQYPVGFGMGTYHVTDWNEEVARVGLKFCQGVGIRGLGNPEFKLDSRDGKLKLIECNHRFSMVNELLRRAGVNTPLLAYSRLVGKPVEVTGIYRRGLHLWFPTGDVRAFIEERRRGQMTTRQWARSLMHQQHLALFDLSDPGPAFAVWRARLLGRAARSSGQPA